MDRRTFLKELGMWGLGAAAGALGVEKFIGSNKNVENTKNNDVFNPDEVEEENFGESIQPEMKEAKEDFIAESEAIYQEFLRMIGGLPPAEQEQLKQEWDRIAQKEKNKMYERRFNNSDEQMRRFFKRVIDHGDYRKQLAGLAEKYGAECGVPVDILLGIIGVESGGDPNARSTSKPSARGILQLVPITAREMGLKEDERCDVEKNIKAGAGYLAKMKERFGSWGLALIAFCEGPTKLSSQLRELEVPDEKKTIVHLYSREFYGRGATHPFQYPFYVNAMSRQMLNVVNDGKIFSIEL